MQDNLPRLDLTGALEAMDNDREMYRNILDAYLESIPPIISEMLSLLRTNDLPTLIRNAHSLKSSSRSVGALRLGAAAENLERMAMAIPSAEIEEKISLVKEEFGYVCKQLVNEGFEVSSPF